MFCKTFSCLQSLAMPIENQKNLSDEEIKLAHQILSSRPSSSSAVLIPKGGVKFSENRGTDVENLRQQSYYNARKGVLSSLKVRKIANLGLAEWLPEYSVAKIIRQGKFLQVHGFFHENDFLALYPEEALFLLDVGDIELTFNGMLLSMQDAYSLLLFSQTKPNSCSFDQYCVYAHLCRMGYRVQRFQDEFNDSSDKRPFDNSTDSPVKAKKLKRLDTNNLMDNTNKKKSCDTSNNNVEFETQKSNIDCFETPKTVNPSAFRGWWFDSDKKKTLPSSITTLICNSPNSELSSVALPSLDKHDQYLVFDELPECLIPPQTCSWKYEIENIWYERLKKDDQSNSKPKLVYSHPKSLDYNNICRKAKSWSHFNSLVKSAHEEKRENMKSLSLLMHGGEIKPLLQIETVNSWKSVQNRLQVIQHKKFEREIPCSDTYSIDFNIFQATPEKSFKKSSPGKPFVRISVVNSDDFVPDFAEIKALNLTSDGIPVKIALVNCGKVMFFGFDNIDIPNHLLAS